MDMSTMVFSILLVLFFGALIIVDSENDIIINELKKLKSDIKKLTKEEARGYVEFMDHKYPILKRVDLIENRLDNLPEHKAKQAEELLKQAKRLLEE